MSRSGDYISATTRRFVAERANHQCEYCLMPDHQDLTYYSHHIDYIRSIKHRGATTVDNLTYACMYCNGAKGADIGTIHDPTDEFVYFYNPRVDSWDDHFALRNFVIEPLTPKGWVTAVMLQFNTPERIEARRLIF